MNAGGKGKAIKRAKLNELHENSHSKEALPHASQGASGSTDTKGGKNPKAGLSKETAGDADRVYMQAHLATVVIHRGKPRVDYRQMYKPYVMDAACLPRRYAIDTTTVGNAALILPCQAEVYSGSTLPPRYS
jgi:hypothetical protein